MAPGDDDPVLDTQNVLWHFGALSGTVAAVAVIGEVHASARGLWILLASLAFVAAYAAASAWLLGSRRRVPGGIVASTAVSFVPLAAMGFERLIGVWGGGGGTPAADAEGLRVSGPGVASSARFVGHDFAVAVAPVVAGLLVFALVRYAFVFAWVAVAALLAVQLFLPAFVAHPNARDHVDALLVSGIVFVAIGLYTDLFHARRIGFWWHLTGLLAVAAAFVYDTELHHSPGWVVVLIAGVAVLAAAAPLHRATWALFGVLWTWAALGHYSASWFGTLGIAFALFAIGAVLVGVGVAIQQAGDSWSGALARRARPT